MQRNRLLNGRFSILILVTQLERAGAQKIALHQARYFSSRGHKVILAFFYDKQGLLEGLRSSEPYTVVDLEAKVPHEFPLWTALRTVRALFRLYRILKRERIQVLETLTHYSNVLGILVGWLAGVPIRISSQRNSLYNLPKLFWRLDAWIVNSRLVDKMVVVSKETWGFCVEKEGMRPDKLVIIPNGVELDRFSRDRFSETELKQLREDLGIPEDAKVVITVARLHAQKGYSYLIEAACRVLRVYPRVRFLFVGDGDLRQELEREIERKQVSSYVYLLGSRPDVPRLLALSDLFVLPSLYEGMPNVVLEAMAARLPVVATNVDGTVEVVAHGETGFLVPKKDTKGLAEAMLVLLRNDVLRQSMGEKGFERVRRHFSIQVMLQRYEELFAQVVAEKGMG